MNYFELEMIYFRNMRGFVIMSDGWWRYLRQ